MKSRMIFIVLLIVSMPISFAKDVVIPIVYDSSEKSVSGETTYFYVGSKLLASKDSSGVNYHYQDRLGSDVDSRSLPFGQSLEIGERFSFTGKELDENLYYFNARYYDSSLGRFTSVDPIKGELSYGYVMNNPMNLVDPYGTESFPQPNTASRDMTYVDPSNYDPNIIREYTGNVEENWDGKGNTYMEGINPYGESIWIPCETPGCQLPDHQDPILMGALFFVGAIESYATWGFRGVVGDAIMETTGLPVNPVRLLASDINPGLWRIFDPSASPGKRIIDVDTETLVKYLDESGQLTAGNGPLRVNIEFTDLSYNLARHQSSELRRWERAIELDPTLDPSLRPKFSTDHVGMFGNARKRLDDLSGVLKRSISDEQSGLVSFYSN